MGPPTTIAPLPANRLAEIIAALGIDRAAVRATARLENGPVWQVLEMARAEDVLAVEAARVRELGSAAIGLIAAHPEGGDCAYEIRMLSGAANRQEDPITGSLIAARAVWLNDAGRLSQPITVAQGTRLGRIGRAFIRPDPGRAGRILKRR